MAEITLNMNRSAGVIRRGIYGQHAGQPSGGIYGGIFVGRDGAIPNVNGMRADAVEALRALRVPVLRWPGGRLADRYHWEDGVGPVRRRTANAIGRGGVEDNSFGTHEFLELCRQLGCEPYVAANLGGGTVREMAEWLEYLNAEGDTDVVRRRRENGRREPWGVRLWGFGSESWGAGGGMLAEEYAAAYRRYQTFCQDWDGRGLTRIACGPCGADEHWTDALMRLAGGQMDGLSMRYFASLGEGERRGAAARVTRLNYYRALFRAQAIDGLLSAHARIMDRYDPERRVGLIVDEWGALPEPEPFTDAPALCARNTMRDALAAAIVLNALNRHCARVFMATFAQAVNAPRALLLADGPRLARTPAYHVFDLFKAHQDAREIDCFIEADNVGMDEWILPQLAASASEKKGVVLVTAANLSFDEDLPVNIALAAPRRIAHASGRILHAEPWLYNDFERSPVFPVPLDARLSCANGTASLTLPPCSVAELRLETA